MIGLDTSTLIEFTKGNVDLNKLFTEYDTYCTTTTNMQELKVGLFEKEKKVYQAIKKSLIILPFTIESVDRATEIVTKNKKKGKTVDLFDCMITGCLLSHNVSSIMTHNVKQFKQINEMIVIDAN